MKKKRYVVQLFRFRKEIENKGFSYYVLLVYPCAGVREKAT